MVTKFVEEEGIEEVIIKNIVIMLLLYTDDVVLFVKFNLEDVQKLMRALQMFYKYTKMSVNSSKMIIVLMKSQNKEKACIVYNNK